MSRIHKSRNNQVSFMNTNRKTQSNQRNVKTSGSSVRRIKVILSMDKTLNDIAHVLRTKYNCDLGNCHYYLNDHILLEGNKPISCHCTIDTGLVAVIMEIKSMPTHYEKIRYNRLNIVDILSYKIDNPDAAQNFDEMIITDINQAGTEVLDGAPLDSLFETLNPDGLTAEQEAMLVPQQSVFDSYALASRAMEKISPPQPPTRPTHPSTLHLGVPHFGLSSDSANILSNRADNFETKFGGKWIIDENYRRRLVENKIPRDPSNWNTIHVVMWINWALKEFELMGKPQTDSRHIPPNGGGDGGKLAKVFNGLSGSQLIDLTIPQLIEKFKSSGSTATINVQFLTHFELLKACHEVCVPLKSQTQTYPTQAPNYSQRVNRTTTRPKGRNVRPDFSSFVAYTPDANTSNPRYFGPNAANNGLYPPPYPLRLNDHKPATGKPEFPSQSSSFYRENILTTNSRPLLSSLGIVNTFDSNGASDTPPFPSATSVDSLEGHYSFPADGPNNGLLFVQQPIAPTTGQYRVVSGFSPMHEQGAALAMTPLGQSGSASGSGNQVQLWQFLLDLLTDWRHLHSIRWVNGDGEFVLSKPERVAALWGQRKNKPTMNYEKLSRALRYYYDGDMISKVQSKRFCYKFVCDLKLLLGYSAAEIHQFVVRCAEKHGMSVRGLELDESRKRPFSEEEAFFNLPSPKKRRTISPLMLNGAVGDFESDSTSADVEVSPHFLRADDEDSSTHHPSSHDGFDRLHFRHLTEDFGHDLDASDLRSPTRFL